MGKLVKESGKKIRALYIGGGTPTTLSPKQLKELMEEISRHFDLTWIDVPPALLMRLSAV